jgi:hypothetical protein
MTAIATLRRTGLVLGTAVVGAAMLLACAAGPAQAAPAPATTTSESTSEADWMRAGEARFETLPGLAPLLPVPGRKMALNQAQIRRLAGRDPWLATGLTLAAPLALAAPALAGIWLPALAAPLAIAAGHLYVGAAERAAGVGLGGLGAAGLGALAGWGASAALGLPAATVWGAGLGAGAYGAWAAVDVYGEALRTSETQVLTITR